MNAEVIALSHWNTERILDALASLDASPLPDDVIEILTEDYQLLKFPEQFLSPTFPAAQVTWSRTSRPVDAVFAEITEKVRDWRLDTVHWWVTKATLPVETESILCARGGALSDTYQILAHELCSDTPKRPSSSEISVELVHDERTFEAATFIETIGWDRTSLDETEANKQFVKTLKDLQEWDGFQLVVFVNGEPASTGHCTLNGEVARLWGAVTLPNFRRRGCYRALLSERMRCAEEHGATLALTRGRPKTSGPILIRAGFTAHAEERCYQIEV